MKVFITGATGFIGSHLTRLVVNEGHEVYALIREGSDTWKIRDIEPRLKVVRGDLLEWEQVAIQLRGIQPELCLHLAWYTVPGKYWTSLENLRHLDSSLKLASLLAQQGCRRMVATGTCVEYDTEIGYLSESTPNRATSLYASSKLAVWTVLEQLSQITGMEAAWVRPFYQYGPFEDQRRLVPAVISSLLRGQVAKVTPGEQIKDFLHVEDVASAIWAVARSNLSGPANIGSGRPVSVRDIVVKIGAILERPELLDIGAQPYFPGDPMFICANNSMLTENTDWAPVHDLDSGLRHTIEWWRAHLGSSVADRTGR